MKEIEHAVANLPNIEELAESKSETVSELAQEVVSQNAVNAVVKNDMNCTKEEASQKKPVQQATDNNEFRVNC